MIDDYNREGPCIDVDFPHPSKGQDINQVIKWRVRPLINRDSEPPRVSWRLVGLSQAATVTA